MVCARRGEHGLRAPRSACYNGKNAMGGNARASGQAAHRRRADPRQAKRAVAEGRARVNGEAVRDPGAARGRRGGAARRKAVSEPGEGLLDAAQARRGADRRYARRAGEDGLRAPAGERAPPRAFAHRAAGQGRDGSSALHHPRGASAPPHLAQICRGKGLHRPRGGHAGRFGRGDPGRGRRPFRLHRPPRAAGCAGKKGWCA